MSGYRMFCFGLFSNLYDLPLMLIKTVRPMWIARLARRLRSKRDSLQKAGLLAFRDRLRKRTLELFEGMRDGSFKKGTMFKGKSAIWPLPIFDAWSYNVQDLLQGSSQNLIPIGVFTQVRLTHGERLYWNRCRTRCVTLEFCLDAQGSFMIGFVSSVGIRIWFAPTPKGIRKEENFSSYRCQ